MPKIIRRVVTGHDANGKAVVISDGPSPFIHINPRDADNVSTDIWRTADTPAPIASHPAETAMGPRRQLPQKRGTVVRINQLPPESEATRAMTHEDSGRAFAALGNETAALWGKGGRHPLMHRTETVDYAIVLEGEVTMVLDKEDVVLKAGDMVVQVGTAHAWSNRSNANCTIAFVLIDGEFEPALKAKFEK